MYKYGNGGRLEKVIQAAVSTTSIPTTSYGYDGNGNRTAVTNPKRQTAGASPETGTAQCGTAGTGDNENDDAADDSIIDDGCPSAMYAYDNLDRLQSVTGAIDYLGRVAVTSYQYDAASNLTQRTDARNLVTKYFPDDMNRLDLIEHWNGMTLVDSVDYAYNAVSFRTQMVDPTGTTSYTPDALDRVLSVTFPGPKIIIYTYDDAPSGSAADYPGRRTKITYPDGKYVDYTYRADGLLNTVSDWLGKQTVYTYDYAGRLTETRLPNTTCTMYGYDAANRLTSVVNRRMVDPLICAPTDTTISSYTYTLDSVGNRTQMTDLAGTHGYQYDALRRLTQATYPGQQTDTYQYDANGNRAFKNATSYTYDAADQMTATGGVNYGYDPSGNQTSRGTDTFSYDYENRLTQAVIGGATSSSVYNGDGLRMSHTASGNTTNYTWDVVAELPLVLQDGANTYVYGLDLISATDSGGAQTYFLYDGLGSTTGLTDGSGNNPVSYSYDVFGAIRSQTGTSVNYWLFTGEQRDSSEALYYLRARYYDPTIGRFLSQDPIAVQSGIPDRYSYVANNPVNQTDPSGLCIPGVRCPVVHCATNPIECLNGSASCARDPFRCTYKDRSHFTRALEELVYSQSSGKTEKEGGIRYVYNCTGLCADLLGKYDAITIGHSIFTKESQGDFGEQIKRHEQKHVRQYEILGDLFWPTYAGSAGEAALACASKIATGGFAECVHDSNILEILAGPDH